MNTNKVSWTVFRVLGAAVGISAAGLAQGINGPNGPFAQQTAYMTYNSATAAFDLSKPIRYQLPDPKKFGGGPYPVFMWSPGTWEVYNDPLSMRIVGEMADRGFVAATIAYDYWGDNTLSRECTSIRHQTQGVYDASRETSAVAVLCALPNADCGKGLVVSGISQGGFLAVLARNYAPDVDAVFALSMSDFNKSANVSMASCSDKQYTAIAANRLTIVNGVSDPKFGGQQPLENVSGFTCPDGATQCWSPDNSGAGWYIVQDSQVVSGQAGHCYMLVNGCSPMERGDPGWMPPATSNWSLAPNLDWLRTLGTQRVFGSQ
jgi:hypothetical protein